MFGKQVIQRCPVRTKPPTEKQIAARRIFVEKYRKTRRNTEERRSGNEVVSRETMEIGLEDALWANDYSVKCKV
jgi:hypothetical protein